MYSVEELDQLSHEMGPEASDRSDQWFVERDIAQFEDLISFWSGTSSSVALLLRTYVKGGTITEAADLIAENAAAFAIGVQYGYEIRQRQELSRAVQE